MSNVSFQVARMEQELFYLNGFRAGVEGTELPPGSADEFARGYGAGSVERAVKERARALELHLAGLRWALAGEKEPTTSCAEFDAGRDEGTRLRAEILVSAGVVAAPRGRCVRDDGVELRRTESGFVDDNPSPPSAPDKWGSTDTRRCHVARAKDWLPVIKHRVHLPVAADVSVGAHGVLDHFEGDLAVMVDGVVSEMSVRDWYSKEQSGFKLGGYVTLLAGYHDIALVARGAGVVGKRTVYVEVRSVVSKPPETYAAPLTPDMPVTYTNTVGGLSEGGPLLPSEIKAIREILLRELRGDLLRSL